jgi:hypothetical protein
MKAAQSKVWSTRESGVDAPGRDHALTNHMKTPWLRQSEIETAEHLFDI